MLVSIMAAASQPAAREPSVFWSQAGPILLGSLAGAVATGFALYWLTLRIRRWEHRRDCLVQFLETFCLTCNTTMATVNQEKGTRQIAEGAMPPWIAAKTAAHLYAGDPFDRRASGSIEDLTARAEDAFKTPDKTEWEQVQLEIEKYVHETMGFKSRWQRLKAWLARLWGHTPLGSRPRLWGHV